MSSSVANPQGTNVYIQRAHSVHSQAIVGRMQSISRKQAHRLRALGTTGIRNIMKMKKNKFNPRARAIANGYRSGLEEKVQADLVNRGVDAEYECFRIPYVVPQSDHFYTPDFLLPNGIVIETKGRFTLEDRRKHLLLKEQYPDLCLRFVFTNSKGKIRKGSNTTYQMWCDRYGFKCADKLVPLEWIKERKNRPSLKIINGLRGVK